MIKKIYFDKFKDREVWLYELSNEKLKVGITDFGGAIQYIKVSTPSKDIDVCLGFNSIDEYLASGTYCGATIGRVANRIGGAKFSLNDNEYKLSVNDGNNTLHGGKFGFDKLFFDAVICGDTLTLSLESPDSDMGFPGNLKFKAEFSLNGGSLEIKYTAQCDKDTIWIPTCHAYFNLGDSKIYDSLLKINADRYTPIDGGLIPTGEIASVSGTPFDFTAFKQIGSDINADNEQLKLAGGYDHNFVLNGRHAATVMSEKSGITMDVFTDMPAMQFYSGNMIKGNGSHGKLYPRDGFCLEPQYCPNSANIAEFECPVLKAGETKKHYIHYIFS